MLQWKAPDAKWFVGGKLNVSYNCLDRHLDTPTANKAALIWEGEPAAPGKPGEERTLTYRQLHREVCLFANVLKRNGIQQRRSGHHLFADGAGGGDRDAGLRADRRGPFGGVWRIQRAIGGGPHFRLPGEAGDYGGWRLSPRGSRAAEEKCDDALLLKDAKGELLAKTIEKVIVLRRANNDMHIEEGRDVWWHRELEYVDANCPAEKMDSEAPLFILYTSGSTGKPKGILHTTGGYLLGAKMTTKYVFDLQDDGCLLVHGGCRLGDGAQLCGLWAAGQRRDQLDV